MTARPTLRKRAGLLLLRVAGWLAVRGLHLAGASSLTVETPEYAQQREEAARRMREAFSRALGMAPGPGIAGAGPTPPCPCPRCTKQRAGAASRWN